MYQGYSENNLLLKDECNFDESLVMTPVNMVPLSLNFGKPKSRIVLPQSKQRLGDYEDYKLTPYLYRGLNNQSIDLNVIHDKKSSEIGSTIQVISIDEGSKVIEIGHHFIELMSKYSAMNVCFVSVTGQKQSGKSFFCDKLLNLAEVKGNNFTQRRNPGIYTYQFPFIKDDLFIFFLQIAGCEIDSEIYNRLNTIGLVISQAYVFIPGEKNLQKNLQKFVHSLNKCSQNYLQRFGVNNPQSQTIFPQNFFCLESSSKQYKINQEIVSQIQKKFKQIYKQYLPIATTPNNKQKKQDLSFISFLARDFINPEYIKQSSNIFKKIYETTCQKRYNDLLINGNIVIKVLLQMVSSFNSKKKIKIHQLYENIIKDLYISAYNYCVLGYHEQLQGFFQDEQPKNSEQMFEMFGNASQRALDKFNQFNLSKTLHQEYQQKLLAHIQKKQQLLCSINRQKTIEYLRQQLSKFEINSNDDPRKVINQLKCYREYLDDGRSQALTEKMVELFNVYSSGSDASLYKRLEQLTHEKQTLRQKLKEAQANQQITISNQQTINGLDKQITRLKGEIQASTKKMSEIKNINFQADRITQLKKQLQKLTEKQLQASSKLRGFKQQNHQATLNQLRESFEQKKNNIKKRQAQIQKQIEENQKQNPKQDTKKDTSKMNQSEVKKSEVKKPSEVKKK